MVLAGLPRHDQPARRRDATIASPSRAVPTSRASPRAATALEIAPEIERLEKFLRAVPARARAARLRGRRGQARRARLPLRDRGRRRPVAAAGISHDVQAHRVVVDLKGRLSRAPTPPWWPLVLGDNYVSPEVATAQFRVDAAPELRHRIGGPWTPLRRPPPQRAPLRVGALPDRGRVEPHLRRHAHRQPGARQPLRARRLRDRLGGRAARSAPPPRRACWMYAAPAGRRDRRRRCWARCSSRRCCARSTAAPRSTSSSSPSGCS